MATDDHKIIKRREAIVLGLERYYTGKPCKRGHVAFRSTKWRLCDTCLRENIKKYWRQKNPITRAEKVEQRRYEVAERRRERQRKYYYKNKDIVATYGRLYRSRKRGSGGAHTAQDILEIFDLQKGRCAYCRTKLTIRTKEVDHIIPVSKGGSDARWNLQILCERCNLRKWSKDPIEFAREQGKLL